MSCFIFLGATECFLLSSMAYDHYVAICNPLHYPIIMYTRLCWSLVFGRYLIGFMDSFVNGLCMSRLHFCKSNIIFHFFCDLSPILALSCTDTHDIEIIISTFAGSSLVLSLLTIAVSYVSILSTILKITSTSSKQKVFSTCASHLLGVTIFYGTMIFTYLKPSKSYSLGKDQIASVFYTIVIPMLNLPIYSLRNKEVKNAFSRVMQKMKWKSLSRVQFFVTPWTIQSMESSRPEVGSLSHLQGIFLIQRSNLGLLHFRQILYQLSHKGSPRIPEWVTCPFSRGSSRPWNQTRVFCIAGLFLPTELWGKPR